MRILVTGANGFVGAHLCELLLERGHEVVAIVRSAGSAPAGTREVQVSDIGSPADWSDSLHNVDAVIHLAARVHVMHDRAQDPLSEFRRVNVAGSVALARAADLAGVSRFVYLSSIKVNGEQTYGKPFTASDRPGPLDPYGISKHEAEAALRDIERDSELELVVVRTPLVYGPNVRGNFLRMLDLTRSGIPLPLGSVRNRRTLASVWNLTDLLERAVVEDDAAGALMLAGDSFSPSTAQLLREIAKSMKRRSRVVRFPVGLLEFAGRVTGKTGLISRLVGSLEVEAGSSSNGWKWTPKFTFANSIERTVQWYAARPSAGQNLARERTDVSIDSAGHKGEQQI
jgi:nucleoside-diphosphate-sugar epimerase